MQQWGGGSIAEGLGQKGGFQTMGLQGVHSGVEFVSH
jgi:hypothetical protein